MIIDTAVLKNINNALYDEMSRDIFKYRLLHSIFDEEFNSLFCSNLKQMIHIAMPDNPLNHFYSRTKICLYGGGEGAAFAIAMMKNIFVHIGFIIDRKQRGEVDGIPIISPEDFFKLPDYSEYLIITTVGEKLQAEVFEFLRKHNLEIISFYGEMWEMAEHQYFDLTELNLQDDEVFVDAGALYGETTKAFLKRCPHGKSYAFEPDETSYTICKKNLGNYTNAVPLCYGLWDREATLKFCGSSEIVNKGGSCVSDNGATTVYAVALDEFLNNTKITFIKMDIEGAELSALKGSARIIREQKPKLAISIYHKPEDIYEIPKLLLHLNPSYKLYIRHYHAMGGYETVLYAIP